MNILRVLFLPLAVLAYLKVALAIEILQELLSTNVEEDISFYLDHDLSKVRDWFVPRTQSVDDDDDDREDNQTSSDASRRSGNDVFDEIPTNEYFEETAQEYNNITRLLSITMTRRQRNIAGAYSKSQFNDPQDPGKDLLKDEKLYAINLQWLVHARYQVYAALRQRERWRKDGRYRLGYLFNRLRRILYDSQKLISASKQQNNVGEFQSLTNLMRIHQKLVRYHMDVRNIVPIIQDLSKGKQAY